MQPRPHIANRARVKAITAVRRFVHGGDAVYKPLHLSVTDRLTQNTHGHESQLWRHGENCSKRPPHGHRFSSVTGDGAITRTCSCTTSTSTPAAAAQTQAASLLSHWKPRATASGNRPHPRRLFPTPLARKYS